ncbi:MAG: tetratricopeptide repeat protein [Myxococcales bacterium]|nr:tetratricopeptide repeat protein [Myxococcales bacterium]
MNAPTVVAPGVPGPAVPVAPAAQQPAPPVSAPPQPSAAAAESNRRVLQAVAATPPAVKPGGPNVSAKAQAAKPARAKKPPVERASKVEPTADVVIPEGADATDLLYSGKRKLEAGDLGGAIDELRASQQLRPSARTLTLLGRALFDNGDLAQAAKVLQQAGGLDDAQLLLGTLYQQTGKPDKARKVYEAFLAKHADHPKAEWVRRLVDTL